jgi:hypothetical protein
VKGRVIEPYFEHPIKPGWRIRWRPDRDNTLEHSCERLIEQVEARLAEVHLEHDPDGRVPQLLLCDVLITAEVGSVDDANGHGQALDQRRLSQMYRRDRYV